MHPSVFKTAETMRARRIDNFKHWREQMIREGKIKSRYDVLKKNGDLAELVGVILGDGHICNFPRTQSLRVVAHSSNTGFIDRYSTLIEKVFSKSPRVSKRKNCNATDIGIYEKNISERLGIPAGSRATYDVKVPLWIRTEPKFVIRYLRGLYEAEGSIHFHAATYTHKLIFTNRNKTLLHIVFTLLEELGFHPHKSGPRVQVSRKQEVQKLKKLLKFRRY